MQIEAWIWVGAIAGMVGLLWYVWSRYRATPPGLVVLQQENQALHAQL